MSKKINNRPLSGYKHTDTFEKKPIVKPIRFSVNQMMEAIERQHKAGYKKFSDFARDCILSREIVERVTPEQMEILNQLTREGNNLNQIATACNARRCWSVADEALKVLRKLDAIIDRFNENKT